MSRFNREKPCILLFQGVPVSRTFDCAIVQQTGPKGTLRARFLGSLGMTRKLTVLLSNGPEIPWLCHGMTRILTVLLSNGPIKPANATWGRVLHTEWHKLITALCPLPSGLCPLPSGLWPLPSAFWPLPSAFWPLPSAYCPLIT